MKTRKRLLVLLIVLTAATLGFIFSMSLSGPDDSSDQSSRVYEWLSPLFQPILGEHYTEHFVRKLAHFSEYFLLGAEICGIKLLMKKSAGWYLLAGILAPLTDETIQIFTGRGPQIQDVWLDVSGEVCGALILFLIVLLIRRIRQKRNREYELCS